MALHMSTTSDLDEDAPRPIDAESVASGAFDRLEVGQGAVSASSAKGVKGSPAHRDEDAPHMSRRTLALVVGAALLVIALIVVVFVRVLDAPAPSVEEPTEVEQTAVAANESVTSHGTSYKLAQSDGVYQLVEVREGEGGQEVPLGDLSGEPVSLVLYDGALIVPENLGNGTWDAMAYTIGSGWSQVMDQGGNAVGGKGTISEAQLEGSTIVLLVDGSRVEVPLVW